MARHVLVVEDEPSIRETLVSLLASEGYCTEQAADGAEALDAVAVQVPDVILLDLMLPRLDGWQFLARLRAIPVGARLPVLVLSASPRPQWDPAQITGVLAYLPKPFRVAEVLEEVRFLDAFAQTRHRQN